MRTFALLVIIAFASCCTPQTAHDGVKHLAEIIKPSGWPIPVHGPSLGIESTPFGKRHDVVKAIRYKPRGHFPLPFYYLDEQGALVLRSYYWHAKTLYALEYNGARFGYTALAEGEGIGIAGPVYWIDMDGDGNFEKVRWGSSEELEIPKWVVQIQH